MTDVMVLLVQSGDFSYFSPQVENTLSDGVRLRKQHLLQYARHKW